MFLGDFDLVYGGYVRGIGRKNLLEFCLEKELCQISDLRDRKRKVTFRLGKNQTEIDSMLTRKQHKPFLRNVKAIQVEKVQ